jgi:hypothetical protein
VGTASLMRAQSSKKEFAGEFGQRYLALKSKFKSVRVEDIRSYKLVGSAGISFLRSEEEFEGGDKDFASDLLSLSESLLDVGLGIAPGSSLVKDSYELIFGTNMVTGEELSELDRGIALVGVGVGVVSFGSAGGVATTLLRSKKLAKLADHFWNVSAKFLKTSKDVFDKALVVGENIVEGAWKLGKTTKEAIAKHFDDLSYIFRDEFGDLNIGLTWKDITKYAGNSTAPVRNMNEFFQSSSFGKAISNSSQNTSKLFQGQKVYKVTDKLDDFKYIRRGDHYYLDNLHKNHIEVFDKKGKSKWVLNLDGTINIDKTAKAKGRTINLK